MIGLEPTSSGLEDRLSTFREALAVLETLTGFEPPTYPTFEASCSSVELQGRELERLMGREPTLSTLARLRDRRLRYSRKLAPARGFEPLMVCLTGRRLSPWLHRNVIQKNWSGWVDLNHQSPASKAGGLARFSYTQMVEAEGLEPSPY